eukprot:TRINITY_DN31338_c0_g2_i1.p1 TRINITY_DN31338_c0_g2~~TRINITY_DN31338_c0_g2_i1.p1  ORF type:complete len:132 (+),score=12.54 TRINITY_DN31338_c0_g2_i1:158-553(+)
MTYDDRGRSFLPPATAINVAYTVYIVVEARSVRQPDEAIMDYRVAIGCLQGFAWASMSCTALLLIWTMRFADEARGRWYRDTATWICVADALSDGAQSAVDLNGGGFLLKYVAKGSATCGVLWYLRPMASM